MKKFVALLLALCMVASLAACGPKDDTPTESSKPAEDSKPEASESVETKDDVFSRSGKIQIMHSAGLWLEVVQEAEPVLKKTFPNVEFEFVEMGGDHYETLAAVDEMPDIGFGDVSTAMLESDIVLEISDQVKGWMEEHYRNPKMLSTSKGKQYTLSAGTDAYYTGVYYYNKDIFAKEGLKEPATYKEFEDILQKLIDKGYSVPMSHSNWSFGTFPVEQTIIAFHPDAYKDLIANKTDWNDPRIREAVKALDKLMKMGAFGKGLAEKDISSSVSEFVQGDAPMMATYSWNTPSIAGKTDFEVGQFFLPSNNPDYPSGSFYPVHGSVHGGWFVSKSTEDPELTLECMKVLTECEAKYMVHNGKMPNFKVDDEITFKNDLDKERHEMYMNVKEYLPTMTINCFDAALHEEFSTLITEWMLDDTTLDADQFCDRLQALWEENTYFDFY